MVISHNPHLGPVYEKTARRYDLGVKPRCTTHIASLGLWTILVSAQPAGLTNSSHVEITLPPSVASERLFVRYVLAIRNGHRHGWPFGNCHEGDIVCPWL